MIDSKQYLDRINVSHPIEINKKTLFQLQRAHLLSIPFENLDIHYGIPIRLDIKSIYHKIVENKRGGFCYELNGLFNELLNEIGFESKLVSARTYGKDHAYSPEFDHLAIIVNLDGEEILVDVGFGKFSFDPLPIKMNVVLSDNYGDFMFDKYSSSYRRINEIKNDKVFPQYIFSTQGRELLEFEERCEFHQVSKDSHFTQKKVISIAKENGRVTLNNTQLKISQSGIEQIIQIEEDEFELKLLELFGIVIS